MNRGLLEGTPVRWKRWLCPLLIALGLANSAYWEWCRHRISKDVLFHDESWPCAWPYPDRWLDRWHARVYDRVRTETGLIPFHGEWDRLRSWLVLGHGGSILVAWPGIVLLAARPPKQSKARSGT
jgi:hypothetical protein